VFAFFCNAWESGLFNTVRNSVHDEPEKTARLLARHAGSVLFKKFISSLPDGDGGTLEGKGNVKATPGYERMYFDGEDALEGTSSPAEVGPNVSYIERKDGGPWRLK
jgi:hypothetical protein